MVMRLYPPHQQQSGSESCDIEQVFHSDPLSSEKQLYVHEGDSWTLNSTHQAVPLKMVLCDTRVHISWQTASSPSSAPHRRTPPRQSCNNPQPLSFSTIGIRHCAPAPSATERWPLPCSSASPLCSDGETTAPSSPCEIAVPIAAFRSPAAGMTARMSSANTTAGPSNQAPANAPRSPRSPRPTPSTPPGSTPAPIPVSSATATPGSTCPPPDAAVFALKIAINCRQSRKSRNLATASAPLTSPPTCPATSTTASSDSWIPPTAPSSTSPGGGAANIPSTKKPSTSSPFRKASACPPTHPPATARPTSFWASTANPSPPPLTSSFPTAVSKPSGAVPSGSPASPPSPRPRQTPAAST